MKSPSFLLSAAMVWLAFTTAAAEDVLWVEGEQPSVSSWFRHGWFAGQGKTPESGDKLVPIDMKKFSAGNWASHWSKNAGEIRYVLDLPEGDRTLWGRMILHANMQWRLDKAPWARLDLAKGIDTTPIADGRTMAWVKIGTVQAKAGTHTLAFRADVSKDVHKDWAFGGIDCLVLASPDFTPSGISRAAGAKLVRTLPLPVEDDPNWFPFTTQKDDFAPCAIDVSFLLHKPAGKHGPLTIDGGHFAFADGTRVKFLGTNICSAEPGTVTREMADYLARKFPKYGVNAVRFHKFTSPGMAVLKDAKTSTELDPKFMDTMDYFHARLKDGGVYLTWSPIYGHHVLPGDKVLAFDELPKGGTAGLVNFAEDLQDVHLRLLTNLLEHKNPYTGLRYADDPALAFVEIQNEDDIFWHYRLQVQNAPTYRKLLYDKFANWLRARYGSDEAIANAWGKKAINEGESLAARNYEITVHGWWYSLDAMGITKSGQDRTYLRARTADAAAFLHETQNQYYRRAADAIRKTGYKGLAIGSCWGSSGELGHYYNLRSDALAGFIDRHNYTGGGAGGHRLSPGLVHNSSHLGRPGSGLLSTGINRVKNLPFTVSEWLICLPNMWVGEGQALMGAYGMGLQDWNGIFMFGSTVAEPTPSRWDAPRVYTADQPLILGANPGLAFWIHRGDVKPGEPAVENQVSLADLRQGIIGVRDKLVQEGDVKTLADDASTPPAAFAVGRVSLEIVEGPAKSTRADLAKFWDKDKKLIRSNTGELAWNHNGAGVFSLNTPKSKAVCGFAQGKQFTLGDVGIRDIKTRFVALYLSSIPDKPIRESDRLLLIAMARSRNTGMLYSEDETQVLAPGKGPLEMEGVEATIVLPWPKAVVHVLDDYGRRTGKTLSGSSADGRAAVRITPAAQTVYYEITAP